MKRKYNRNLTVRACIGEATVRLAKARYALEAPRCGQLVWRNALELIHDAQKLLQRAEWYAKRSTAQNPKG